MDKSMRTAINTHLYDYGAFTTHKPESGCIVLAAALIEQTEVLREMVEELKNIRRELRDIDTGMNGAFY